MLFIYFLVAIYYLENVFRVMCTGTILGPGVFYTMIFAIPIASIGYLICKLVKRKQQVATLLMGVLTVIFISQFIYFKIFRMFYSLYSVSNAGQILEFWQIVMMKVRNNFLGVVLMSIPFTLFVVLRKRMNWDQKLISKHRVEWLMGALVIQIVAVMSLPLAGKESYSPYDLYFKHSYPVVAAEKMGLLTTLRIETKRSLFNWSPTLAESYEEEIIIKSDERVDSLWMPEAIEVMAQTQLEQSSNHILDVNFTKLIEEAPTEEIKQMHEYFSQVEPTNKNAYTGKYEGYNLITITAEGFAPYAIREDVTPTLYKLYQEGYQFTNYYTPLWELSTSDGEYALWGGQIPKSGIWSMAASGENLMPFALGNQLKSKGYETMAFHNHDYDYYERDISHPNLGYTYEAKGLGLTLTDTWPESDIEMMEQSMSKYIDKEPFHAYYMTVSGHMNYSFRENDMSKKHESEVEELTLSETARAYLACQIELDRALEQLLETLDQAGVLERTLIAIVPDHYPYGLNNEYISELAGEMVDEAFGIYQSVFLLYTPNMEPVIVDKPCSSLDVLPTLSNLMGLEYDSRLLSGRDIFSESDPLVILYSHNFITDKGRYNALTKEFIEASGVDVDEAYVRAKIAEVDERFYYASRVLEEDYYRYIVSALKL